MGDSHKPKTKKDAPKKLDPARASVYVAALALIGTIVTAVIINSNTHGDENHTTYHADEFVPVKEDTYNQVIATLDEQAQALEEEKDSIATDETLSAEKKALKLQKINRCLEKNRAIKSLLITKRRDYQVALKAGDIVKAEAIQNEMSSAIARKLAGDSKRILMLNIGAKPEVSQTFERATPQPSADSMNELLDGLR